MQGIKSPLSKVACIHHKYLIGHFEFGGYILKCLFHPELAGSSWSFVQNFLEQLKVCLSLTLEHLLRNLQKLASKLNFTTFLDNLKGELLEIHSSILFQILFFFFLSFYIFNNLRTNWLPFLLGRQIDLSTYCVCGLEDWEGNQKYSLSIHEGKDIPQIQTFFGTFIELMLRLEKIIGKGKKFENVVVKKYKNN